MDNLAGGGHGELLYDLAKKLFRIPRSLSGDGNRKTLQIIGDIIGPCLVVSEVPSGVRAFDWEIPNEWNVKEAYILTPNGERICDFYVNNLHLVSYSIPFCGHLTWDELEPHLHSLEDYEEAIPYITSYYAPYWGFCLSHKQKLALKESFANTKEKFFVCVDSSLKPGSLSYGEIFIKGVKQKEIILSTYICHPQMANNELSGICVATYLAKYLLSLNPAPLYSYRILFMPETIGAIYYCSRHLEALQKNCLAGFVLSCLGDDGDYSCLYSRKKNTLADRVARHVISHFPNAKEYSYAQRGSDERQFGAVGIDLPFCALMRTKYGEYKQYHTSLDDLSFISPKGLEGGFNFVLAHLESLECNGVYQNTILCEPQLGKRGLYPQISTKKTFEQIKDMRNLLAYCDGSMDLLEIAQECGFYLPSMKEYIQILQQENLLAYVRDQQ